MSFNLSCATKVVGPFFYFLLRSTGGEEKLRALSSKSKKIKKPPASARDEILQMRAQLSRFNKKKTYFTNFAKTGWKLGLRPSRRSFVLQGVGRWHQMTPVPICCGRVLQESVKFHKVINNNINFYTLLKDKSILEQ